MMMRQVNARAALGARTNQHKKVAILLIDRKQLKLSNFCKEFDMSRSSVFELIYSQHLPADIDEFKDWRKNIAK